MIHTMLKRIIEEGVLTTLEATVVVDFKEIEPQVEVIITILRKMCRIILSPHSREDEVDVTTIIVMIQLGKMALLKLHLVVGPDLELIKIMIKQARIQKVIG